MFKKLFALIVAIAIISGPISAELSTSEKRWRTWSFIGMGVSGAGIVANSIVVGYFSSGSFVVGFDCTPAECCRIGAHHAVGNCTAITIMPPVCPSATTAMCPIGNGQYQYANTVSTEQAQTAKAISGTFLALSIVGLLVSGFIGSPFICGDCCPT